MTPMSWLIGNFDFAHSMNFSLVSIANSYAKMTLTGIPTRMGLIIERQEVSFIRKWG